MAIDTAEKRRLALNAGSGWVDSILPIPDGGIDPIDQAQLLHGYYLFGPPLFLTGRHELAMRRLFPLKELITDE